VWPHHPKREIGSLNGGRGSESPGPSEQPGLGFYVLAR
jgi:hypothetical protein